MLTTFDGPGFIWNKNVCFFLQQKNLDGSFEKIIPYAILPPHKLSVLLLTVWVWSLSKMELSLHWTMSS